MNRETILIAGGTGLVGSRLIERIDYSRYKVMILTRSPKKNTDRVSYVSWNTERGNIDSEVLKADHVVNLAGSGIADQRWTEKRKKNLIDSRVQSTKLLHRVFDNNYKALKSYIGASAIGYYGNRGKEKLTESSDPGKEFLSECCILWEEAHKKMEKISQSSAILRIGIVLSTKGGAFAKIRPPMKLGMANYFGNGKQYYSWIHIDDLCNMIMHCIEHPKGHMIYNAVVPQPITNKVFIQKIRKGLKSNAIMATAPAFALKLLLGEMSNVVLNSNRVYPEQILHTEYQYDHPVLEDAAQDIVSKRI